MKVQIQLVDDFGEIVYSESQDATVPITFRSPYEKPFDAGNYWLYAITYQPVCTLKNLADRR